MQTRILVAELGGDGAGAIHSGLEAEDYRVDVARDVDAALRLAELHRYDAILLDVIRFSTAGLAVARQLRRRRITAPMLVLSACDKVEDRVEGLDAGADDFLVKPFSVAELLARLRALLRRQQPATGNVLRVADLELDLLQHHASRAGRRIHLTRREFALLEFLMSASPNPLSKTAIIEHVWGRHFDSGTNVVNVYIKNLRGKIEGDGLPPLLHTIRGVGFACRQVTV